MKAAGILLLMPLAASPAILPAEEPPATKLSTRLTQEIKASLPHYAGPEKPVAPVEAAPPDPGLLLLPKLEVKEKNLAGHDPDVWLTDRAIQQKAMAAYRQSMTDFEWVLNSWFLPPFSVPVAARARAAYDANKRAAEIDRLSHTVDVIEKLDPKAGAELQRELLFDPDLR